MQLNWFKRNGPLFIPRRWPGWIVAAASIGYAVRVAIDLNSSQHSVSDFLMNLVFRFLIIGAVYSLIAYLTSGD